MLYEQTTDYSLDRVLELLEMYQHIPLQATNSDDSTSRSSTVHEMPVMQAE